tara:strand:+ start:6747 stop:7838 length:1092 start_codon:yes stop_codon:yes gene_type:complete
MSDNYPDIKSVVARVITNKPVRKTPYQVKGVFMRQYSDEPIVPMLDGSYRDRFLYPRVQVKILNEQIYIIGVNEGVESVLSICDKFETLDFGNITFEIKECDIEDANQQFIPSKHLVRYRFITPWVALNHMTGGKYKFLTNQEKPSYLNKLLGQNIVFLANEVGISLEDNIFTKVKVSSLFPKPVDENKWGAFMGEFKTNFILPNYIGIGNGVTRGFGTIYGMFNPDSFSFDKEALMEDAKDQEIETLEQREDLECISASDVPKPKRRKRSSNKSKKHNLDNNKKHRNKNKKNKQKYYSSRKKGNFKAGNKHRNQKKRTPGHGHILSEEFDIEEDNRGNNKSDSYKDDDKFNTEQHHKKQHKF